MLDWAADFDLELENMIEDMTNEHKINNLIANEELEIKEISLIEIQTQRYVSVYLIYKHAVSKSKGEKRLRLMRKMNGNLMDLSESSIKSKEYSGVSATHFRYPKYGWFGMCQAQMGWFRILFDQRICTEDGKDLI